MRGRKPKPSTLKALAGNPGKRKPNAQEPVYAAPPADGEPPADMPPAGVRFWHEYYPRLQASGVLKETDLPAFEVLCRTWARLQDADGVKVSFSKAFAEWRAMANEFGMTPSARSRVKADAPASKDEFEDFLGDGVVGRIG